MQFVEDIQEWINNLSDAIVIILEMQKVLQFYMVISGILLVIMFIVICSINSKLKAQGEKIEKLLSEIKGGKTNGKCSSEHSGGIQCGSILPESGSQPSGE